MSHYIRALTTSWVPQMSKVSSAKDRAIKFLLHFARFYRNSSEPAAISGELKRIEEWLNNNLAASHKEAQRTSINL